MEGMRLVCARLDGDKYHDQNYHIQYGSASVQASVPASAHAAVVTGRKHDEHRWFRIFNFFSVISRGHIEWIVCSACRA